MQYGKTYLFFEHKEKIARFHSGLPVKCKGINYVVIHTPVNRVTRILIVCPLLSARSRSQPSRRYMAFMYNRYPVWAFIPYLIPGETWYENMGRPNTYKSE